METLKKRQRESLDGCLSLARACLCASLFAHGASAFARQLASVQERLLQAVFAILELTNALASPDAHSFEGTSIRDVLEVKRLLTCILETRTCPTKVGRSV